MSLLQRDKEVNWHPFTQMQTAKIRAFTRAKGSLLFDEEGRSYIDAISSWWVNLHGHAHPYIAERINQQLQTLDHIPFAELTHPAAVELSEALLKILPKNQKRIFYSENGSTAVEIALKMAVQYWWNKGEKHTKFVAFDGAYHGDTVGAMSAGANETFSAPFGSMMFSVAQINPPQTSNPTLILQELETIFKKGDCAAFIFEPLVQGASGMRFHNAEGLSKIISLCRRYGVLTIADEVMTGFGRLGKLFASDYLSEQPDIMCMAKGLTGGVVPLAVTSATEEIFNGFLSADRSTAFLHGHSYTAHALGCAAGIASLHLLSQDDCKNNIHRIEKNHAAFVSDFSKDPRLENVRSLGTLLAFEIKSSEPGYYQGLRDKLYEAALSNGLLIRPLGNTVYVLPPYCITDHELSRVYEIIVKISDI